MCELFLILIIIMNFVIGAFLCVKRNAFLCVKRKKTKEIDTRPDPKIPRDPRIDPRVRK